MAPQSAFSVHGPPKSAFGYSGTDSHWSRHYCLLAYLGCRAEFGSMLHRSDSLVLQNSLGFRPPAERRPGPECPVSRTQVALTNGSPLFFRWGRRCRDLVDHRHDCPFSNFGRGPHASRGRPIRPSLTRALRHRATRQRSSLQRVLASVPCARVAGEPSAGSDRRGPLRIKQRQLLESPPAFDLGEGKWSPVVLRSSEGSS